MAAAKARNLVLVLGDQLDHQSAAFDGFDNELDTVWMAEVSDESEYVWSHKARIVIFLSAMRHFRDALLESGIRVNYTTLAATSKRDTSFSSELEKSVRKLRPEKLVVVEPGEWRVRSNLLGTAKKLDIELEIRPDRHFFISSGDFKTYAESRKGLKLEPFYHEMRRRTGYLMDHDKPLLDNWNFDDENRNHFGKDGPGDLPEPVSFAPDQTTRDVIKLVQKRFAHHPGSLDSFDWPVTPQQAEQALHDFIRNRLPLFGSYEDALWTGQPYLYHSRLSSAFNLHLLNPRKACDAARKALKEGRGPINSAEGFIRQLVGWREYIRGVYWTYMPDYEHLNYFDADLPLPDFYWTGDTDANCLRECIGQTLALGFAHHIQRLMITGLYALIAGVKPHEVHKWYLAIYVDAVEWAELPNVLGMSQFADGGLMSTKPYAASGAYINRMSNYCTGCRYDPGTSSGEHACPFTVLYWDFLLRNHGQLTGNRRMALQVRNADRLGQDRQREIRRQADALRSNL